MVTQQQVLAWGRDPLWHQPMAERGQFMSLRNCCLVMGYWLLACSIGQVMAESEEELKSFLMKVKEESEKVGLKLNIQNKQKKLNIQKTKIMASGPITS